MTDGRPDPDDLLQVVKEETHRSGRGQLKIFFGACAGVGKTFAMLQAARQLHAEGASVGIGIVETHGRRETQALTEGLPVVPLKLVGSGRPIKEFDLDGALASGFKLLIVDELAHTNAVGSRHAKRWQDVEELLDAGIDVYTAVNVQHLDSVNDIVGGIIGVRVRETVPDRIFDRATDVVLVDLPPDDLLTRMSAGKVYLPVSIERARQNFFRRGNLIALRELALRKVADRVNADVRTYRISHAIQKVWPTRELVMVCVSAHRSQEALVRESATLAKRLEANWIVVHVDQPHQGDDEQARQTLFNLAATAQGMGAEFANIPGQDVTQTLLDYARKRNATKLVMGNPAGRNVIPFRPRLAERIARANPEIGLILLGVQGTGGQPLRFRPERTAPGYAKALLIATAACSVGAFVANLLLRVFDVANIVMLFLVVVVFVALRLGRMAGAWASLLSVAMLDFFFIEPRLSFVVSDTQYIFTFALMLAVALMISQLAARLRSEARVARAGERRASALARVARNLSGVIKIEQISTICEEAIAPLFDARLELLLPGADNKLVATREYRFLDLSVAQWSYDHVQEAGLGTQTLNAAEALYIPLKGPMAPRGVLAVYPGDQPLTTNPDDRRLLDACCSSIALALERIHFVEVAQDTILRMEGEKLRNTLLSAVSHDLKTPLTAIRGLAETLEHPADLSEGERGELARSIRMQADELKRLVTNLLDLARMQSEGVRLNKDWHTMGEIVGSALSRSAPVLAPRLIRADLPAALPLVEVDAPLIERVLINLLDNAAKYTPPGSTVLVRAGTSGESMYLVVEDNGPGLPGADPEKLFEPFSRGQKESSIAGVGLGLSLCRSIIVAHGGTIHAESRAPHGSVFEIRLPLGAPPEIESETGHD
jgi:two-component system sensor histidine kinase KdpD